MLRKLVLVAVCALCGTAAGCGGGGGSSSDSGKAVVVTRQPCVVVVKNGKGTVTKTTTDTVDSGKPCVTTVYTAGKDSVVPDTTRVDSILTPGSKTTFIPGSGPAGARRP